MISGSNLGATKYILVSPKLQTFGDARCRVSKGFPCGSGLPKCRGGAARADYGTFWGSNRAPGRGPKSPPAIDTWYVTMASPTPIALGIGGIFRGYFNRKRVRRKRVNVFLSPTKLKFCGACTLRIFCKMCFYPLIINWPRHSNSQLLHTSILSFDHVLSLSAIKPLLKANVLTELVMYTDAGWIVELLISTIYKQL